MCAQLDTVALSACAGYDPERVRDALRGTLGPLGGMERFVSRGERIALKPNLLLGAPPERAITTHPAVIEAVVREVREAGADCFLVESPGAGTPYVEASLRRVYEKTGIAGMAERLSLEINYDTSARPVSFAEGVLARRFDVLGPLLDADGVISLSKLKTHTYMTYTGAVKNLFGVVPGYDKPGFHARMVEKEHFADMLLDLALLVGARLHVMDAVLALEGDGPGTGGSPRHVGALLASQDPVALDACACRLVGVPAELVPVLEQARERGLWSGDIADVPTAGESLRALEVDGFLLPEGATESSGFGESTLARRVARPLVRDALSPRPRPKADRCTGCRECARTCPVSCISVTRRLARVDDDRCIRCYCCHEVCPEAAVDLEYTVAGKAINLLSRGAEPLLRLRR